LNVRSILGVPRIYSWFADFVGGDARAVYAREYIRATERSRILDIGCGPGDILEYLPAGAEYTGFDPSADYIASAQARFGTRGKFFCANVGPELVGRLQAFDIVLANGVLHHLDDAQALGLFEVARAALKPGGRLVTLDGCYVQSQSRIEKFLLSMDRGKFVRTEPEYRSLADRVFPTVVSNLRRDLMRIPYTHVIMECRKAGG
jgi:SAM-dependent methyltransferase